MVAIFSSRLIVFSSGSPLEPMRPAPPICSGLLESIGKASKVVERSARHPASQDRLLAGGRGDDPGDPRARALRLVRRDTELSSYPRDERPATNALRINDVMFIRAGCPRTLELLQKHGLKVLPLPVSEIAKIDAGLSCMSLRWFSVSGRSGSQSFLPV